MPGTKRLQFEVLEYMLIKKKNSEGIHLKHYPGGGKRDILKTLLPMLRGYKQYSPAADRKAERIFAGKKKRAETQKVCAETRLWMA